MSNLIKCEIRILAKTGEHNSSNSSNYFLARHKSARKRASCRQKNEILFSVKKAEISKKNFLLGAWPKSKLGIYFASVFLGQSKEKCIEKSMLVVRVSDIREVSN